MDETTMQAGLLMETAQKQQRLTEAALDRLAAMTQDLDVIVRDELRRAFVEELHALGTASRSATEALQTVRRVAGLRMALWSIGITSACSAIPLSLVWTALPSRAEVAQLRAQRDSLALEISQLQKRGGRVDLRRCGGAARLCIRVDRQAPVYGEHSDYLVVKGY
jgi:hypothetical protein